MWHDVYMNCNMKSRSSEFSLENRLTDKYSEINIHESRRRHARLCLSNSVASHDMPFRSSGHSVYQKPSGGPARNYNATCLWKTSSLLIVIYFLRHRCSWCGSYGSSEICRDPHIYGFIQAFSSFFSTTSDFVRIKHHFGPRSLTYNNALVYLLYVHYDDYIYYARYIRHNVLIN